MRRNGKMSLKRNNDAIENYAIELEIPVKCRSHAIPAECYEVLMMSRNTNDEASHNPTNKLEE